MRLVLWSIFFAVPLFEVEPFGDPWSHVIVITLIIFAVSAGWPSLVCASIRFLEFLGSRESEWIRPSLSVSPFKHVKPLQFWWTMYIGFLVAGISALVGSLMHTPDHMKYSLGWLAAGIGGLLGIRICLSLFKTCFEPTGEQARAPDASPGVSFQR